MAVVVNLLKTVHSPSDRDAIVDSLRRRWAITHSLVDIDISCVVSKDHSLVWYSAEYTTEFNSKHKCNGVATTTDCTAITWETWLVPCKVGSHVIYDKVYDEDYDLTGDNCLLCNAFVIGNTQHLQPVTGVVVIKPHSRGDKFRPDTELDENILNPIKHSI